MDRCNELCTKEATGYCTLCAALAERERFIAWWMKTISSLRVSDSACHSR